MACDEAAVVLSATPVIVIGAVFLMGLFMLRYVDACSAVMSKCMRRVRKYWASFLWWLVSSRILFLAVPGRDEIFLHARSRLAAAVPLHGRISRPALPGSRVVDAQHRMRANAPLRNAALLHPGAGCPLPRAPSCLFRGSPSEPARR